MPRSRTAKVYRELRTLYGVGTIRDLGDGQLLERFATDSGEAAELAFAVLVERHGPMVLRVCLSVLSDWHETEDAFQATFLVLVRKARRLWVQDSLGPWLHQVAMRTASAARVAAARRRRCEENATVATRQQPCDAGDVELIRILHEELERLPDRFRLPLVLCDLEACSHQQAARHLGWPIGTVKSRLARGREHLRDRLVRRGLAPGAGLFVAATRHDPSLLLRLPPLIDSTARAALAAVSTRAISGGAIATLTHAVARMMIVSRSAKALGLVLAVVAAGGGSGFLLGQRDQQPSGSPAAAAKQKAADDFPNGTIAKIEFKGTAVPPENINAKLLTRVGHPLDQELLDADLKTILGTRWFSSATYSVDETPPRSGKYTIEFSLTDRIQTAPVKPGHLHAVVSEPGLVTRASTLSAINRVEGESVIRSILPDGSAVKKGDLVCTLDSSALTEQLKAQATLVKSAEAAYQAAVAAREASQAALNDYTASGVASKRSVLKALQDHVEDQKANEQAKQATWDAEKSTEAKLIRQIKDCEIVAPSDGIVVHANDTRFINRRPYIAGGATVRERQIIFKIPDVNSPLQVVTHLPKWSTAHLQGGSKVKIIFSSASNPERVLTGKIDEIAALPDTASFFYDGPPLYTTLVRIDEPPSEIVMDMKVRVEIDVAELDNVLTVPADSVVSFQRKDHVAVQKGSGGFEWREVAVGATDGTSIEVTHGLQSGEVVIREPAKLLSSAERGISNPPARLAPPR